MEVIPVHSVSQFQEVDALYQQAFGDASVPTQVQQAWWQRWPKGMAALQFENDCVGGISVWPIKQEVYQRLCAGAQKERDIAATDIETESPRFFHLSEIVILSHYRHRNHTGMLVRYMLEMLEEILKNRAPLFLTAYAYSEQGSRLMQHLTMQPLMPGHETADGYPLWHLAIQNPQQLLQLRHAFAPI